MSEGGQLLKEEPIGEEAQDEALLLAAQEYPDLFRVLVERYQAPFLRLAMRVLNSKEEAEDTVQDSFLKIYKYSTQLRQTSDSKFKSWAYKIVFNTALTNYRKSKKRIGETEYLDSFLYDSLKDKDIEAEINSKILIKEILEKMPAEFREIIELHYLEDRSYEEISKIKGLTIPALKMKLFRARELFRKLLNDGDNESLLEV